MLARSKAGGPIPDLTEEDEFDLEDRAKAETIARLEAARDFARSNGDARGVAIATERLSLDPPRS